MKQLNRLIVTFAALSFTATLQAQEIALPEIKLDQNLIKQVSADINKDLTTHIQISADRAIEKQIIQGRTALLLASNIRTNKANLIKTAE